MSILIWLVCRTLGNSYRYILQGSWNQQTVTYQTELSANDVLKMGMTAKNIVLYVNYR